MRFVIVFLAVVYAAFSGVAFSAPQESFDQFLVGFEKKALSAGIPKTVYRAATKGLKPDPSIKVSQGSQPEFEKPVWSYLDQRITADRIKRGRSAFTDAHHLIRIEKRIDGTLCILRRCASPPGG